jgi:hypothetical protein
MTIALPISHAPLVTALSAMHGKQPRASGYAVDGGPPLAEGTRPSNYGRGARAAMTGSNHQVHPGNAECTGLLAGPLGDDDPTYPHLAVLVGGSW